MIKLISFDLGGTLYYSKSKKTNKIHKLAKAINVNEEELRFFLKPLLYSQKNTKQQLVELINKKFGIDCKGHLDEIYTSNKKCYLYKDVVPVLKRLTDYGYKLAILSNQNSLINYSDSDISKYFTYKIYSCEVGCCKPNKEIFKILCRKSGLMPCEVLHIGDNYNSDFLGGLNAGLNVLLIDRNNSKSISNENTINSLKGLFRWIDINR